MWSTMPRAPDLSGRALDDRYELQELIGEGAFGRVYRGLDRRLQRSVAVKVIKPWWAEDPDWARSFEREAQLLARVNDPGIVQIFDVGHVREGLYYVAELVDGESLAQLLKHGALPPSGARRIALGLAEALGRAHAEHVVHRDIKPANVLLTAEGRVKIADFGVARLTEGTSEGATVAGTPRYMAPEQSRGRHTSPATDVYAAGVILYEMLAGRPPFVEEGAVDLALAHLSDPPPPLPASVPDDLRAVVAKALAKEPADRFPDGAALAAALTAASPAAPEEAQPTVTMAAAAARDGAGPIQPATVAARTERAPLNRTRVAPRRDLGKTPAKTAARTYTRRRVALGVVLAAIAGGFVALWLALGAGTTTVPALSGLDHAAITDRLHHAGLHARYTRTYSSAALGTAIGQSPKPGTSVSPGTIVAVTLSAGPPPVSVPSVVGQPAATAESAIAGAKLRYGTVPVPALGATPGTVTRQSPAGGTLPPGSTVILDVAQAPQWRPLTSFTGAQSVPFRIRGARWRVVYNLSYTGTCTLIFFCNGPTAQVNQLPGSTQVGQFNLGSGTAQTQTFQTGPGVYQVAVSPGSDQAAYSIAVQDYY
jgi:serine/threonine-protein kinase